MSSFRKHFIRHLGEMNSVGSVLGDVDGAEASWPYDSDFWNTGDTRLASGPKKKKNKKQSTFIQHQLMPIQRRKLDRRM